MIFGVAIGTLAFVLQGQCIEELVRRRAIASTRKLLELEPIMARRQGRDRIRHSMTGTTRGTVPLQDVALDVELSEKTMRR